MPNFRRITITDKDYLEEIIAIYSRLDQLMPDFRVLITDFQGTVLYCSNLYKATRGTDNLEVGSSSLPASGGKYHPDQALAEWQEVAESKKPKHAINVNLFEGVVQPYLTSKYPLINKDSGNVVAIFNIRQKVLYNNIQHQLLRALDIYAESKQVDFSRYNLTKREKQLIFLFLSGLASKEIALVLSKIDGREISKKTIDSIFDNQLKVKFNVFSREALFEKLLRLGFDRLVPADLLVNVKIPLLDIVTY